MSVTHKTIFYGSTQLYIFILFRLLDVRPIILEAAEYSVQKRKRYIWTNLEQMYLDEKAIHSSLQDHLTEPSREALVKKIFTVTSSLNSLRQGKLIYHTKISVLSTHSIHIIITSIRTDRHVSIINLLTS